MKKTIPALLAGLLMTVSLLTVPVSASAAPYCGITWGSLSKGMADYQTEPLTNIRTGRHACYDRMVFDLRSGTTGYFVEYVNNVYADGSGQLVPVAGGAKLQIIVHAPNYDINGNQTYPGVTGQPLPGVNLSGYETFRDAKYAGSFEGQTTVGLGVRARLPFRVSTLDGRLVVDVAHRW